MCHLYMCQVTTAGIYLALASSAMVLNARAKNMLIWHSLISIIIGIKCLYHW